MDKVILVVRDSSHWNKLFLQQKRMLEQAFGEKALRIDHIGSTSVPGLIAKPIVDIQISVPCLQKIKVPSGNMLQIGYRYKPDNPDRTKVYFKKENPSVHLHVRRAGSFSEQLNLLFRDFLRDCPTYRHMYQDAKIRLAASGDRDSYIHEKEELVWKLLFEAHKWQMSKGN